MNKEHHPKNVSEMKSITKREVENLLKNCPEGCRCRELGANNPCHVRDIGLKTFVQCLEEKPLNCLHLIGFGRTYYCSCPACVLMAKGFTA